MPDEDPGVVVQAPQIIRYKKTSKKVQRHEYVSVVIRLNSEIQSLAVHDYVRECPCLRKTEKNVIY